MRVAILTSEYPPFIFGGIGTFAENLAVALAEHGIQVVVMAGWPKRHSERFIGTQPNPIEVIWFPRGNLPPRHLWFQLRNSSAIRKELAKCDVVHGQDVSCFPILQSCKSSGTMIPWIVTFHTNPQAELRLALTSLSQGASLTDFATYVAGFPLWDMTVQQHLRCADALVAVSNSLREELSVGYRFDREKMNVIPTCIDVAGLQRAATRHPSSSQTGEVRLFYGGRLYFRKGILLLLESIRHLLHDLHIHDFVLHVFGTGPLYKQLQAYLNKHNLEAHVKLRGFVPRKTLLSEMSASDIVCMPSMYEACPLTMLEAMSLRKPVVAFDLPFSREILIPDCGKLSTDTFDFARKLAHLIESPDDRDKLGLRAEVQARRRYDAPVIADMYCHQYANCQENLNLTLRETRVEEARYA